MLSFKLQDPLKLFLSIELQESKIQYSACRSQKKEYIFLTDRSHLW